MKITNWNRRLLCDNAELAAVYVDALLPDHSLSCAKSLDAIPVWTLTHFWATIIAGGALKVKSIIKQIYNDDLCIRERTVACVSEFRTASVYATPLLE